MSWQNYIKKKIEELFSEYINEQTKVENRNIAYSRLMKVYSEATGTITCEEDNKEDNKSNGVNYLNFNLYLVLFILLNV